MRFLDRWVKTISSRKRARESIVGCLGYRKTCFQSLSRRTKKKIKGSQGIADLQQDLSDDGKDYDILSYCHCLLRGGCIT